MLAYSFVPLALGRPACLQQAVAGSASRPQLTDTWFAAQVNHYDTYLTQNNYVNVISESSFIFPSAAFAFNVPDFLATFR